MSKLISPCCNEELILVASIDTRRLYKCSKCKNYTDNKTKRKMKNKTIVLEGVEYKLVPVEKIEENKSETFYYGCDSDCGNFRFSVLLNDDGNIWKDTQTVTYYPEGATNKNNTEEWDNLDFLIDVLEDNENDEVTNLRKEIGDPKFINLINILQKVHEKGWI